MDDRSHSRRRRNRATRILLAGTAAGTTALLLVGCTAAPRADTAHGHSTRGPATRGTSTGTPQPRTVAGTSPAFEALEAKYGAAVGLVAVDTGTGRRVAYNANRRFHFASTYKALAAGILLERDSDAQLTATVHYSSGDLVDYSPVTSQHVGTGMSLHDVIAAALQYSDNTAANLMLAQLGGPSGLTTALRAMGDRTTNVNDTEPDVNTATPGDVHNTTTPQAIGADLRSFALGGTLSASRRTILTNLMIGNTTGAPYIRAGVPAYWTVGDKTGNGGYGTRNDIAVVWRPSGSPIVIAVLTNRRAADAASDDALIADVTRSAIGDLTASGQG